MNVYAEVHYRHDSSWMLSEPAGQSICLACIVEMMEDGSIAVVRKKHILSIFQMLLKTRTSKVTEILANDGRICAHFIQTLLGLLLNMEDGSALELVTEILVQLIASVNAEEYCHCVLDKCHKELLNYKTNFKVSLPVFNFLGKLVDSMPSLADRFASEHYDLVEYMLQCLLYPNEAVKTAICYLYGKLYCSPTAVQKLYTHFSDNLCGPFLATLEMAQTQELQINCIGLLKQLVHYDYFVTVVMNDSGCQSDSESTPTLQAQNPLPLILKKVLLNADESLQIASTQCITAVIVHCPTKYAPAFIHADIPELLFEYLSSTSEFLIWSIYCCLLLMTEENLFFSKCHTVYGIEALIRSLKDALQMNNKVLLKQGLLLLTQICERQPTDLKLFTNPAIFKKTTDVILEAVSYPVLDVALEAIKCASAFLSTNHLSTPVQYGELQRLVSKIVEHCADYTLPPTNRRPVAHQANKERLKNITRRGQLLTNTLQAFQNACRLALACQSNPHVQENPFVAPNSESEETLETFSCFLLEICDNICVPTVMKYYETSPIPAAMEIFFSLLCDICAIVPVMKTTFCMKLASASFIRLAMEVKYTLCSGFRNSNLNQTCSTFLGMLCSSLWAVAANETGDSQNEVSDVLQRSLITLSCSIPESLSILLAMPSEHKDIRCQQYALLLVFCVAFIFEDRFIKEEDLFLAVLGFLQSVQCHGDHISSYVIRAAFFLMTVCQEKCDDLDTTSVNLICKLLKDTQDVKIMHFHHPLYLKFFFRYPQLRENYGCSIITFWILNEDTNQIFDEDILHSPNNLSDLTNNQGYFLPLLNILQSNPNSIPVFLDFIMSGPSELSQKALLILKVFLKGNMNSFVSSLFANQLLQVLQKIIQSTDANLQDKNLPLILSLLYLLRLNSQNEILEDNINFKLLYHVCNLSGKCSPPNVSVLQPAFNFMYCSLHQANDTCRMRGTAMLLSNIPLIELIQKILDFTWDYSFSSNQTLCSSACLITSSLVSYQKTYNLEVYRSLHIDVNKLLHLIVFKTKRTSSLFAVCLIQLLKTMLRERFGSPMLKIIHSDSKTYLFAEHQSTDEPINIEYVFYLHAALQNLLVQKDFLLVHATTSCLESLLCFLYLKDRSIVHHIVSQPWNRFVLYTSFNSSESGILQPGFLRFLTLMLRYESASIFTEKEIKQHLDNVSKLFLSELPISAALDLQMFLNQLQNTKYVTEPDERALVMELLKRIASVQKDTVTDKILYINGVTVSLSQVAT